MDEIIESINAGELRASDKKEIQHELTERYDVSLIAIKRALTEFISTGILYARVDKGTYVGDRKRANDFSN